MKNLFFPLIALAVLAVSCKPKEPTPSEEPKLILYFEFDSTMTRLDNFGNPVGIGSGNAAQHPKMNFMSAHYIELTPHALTQVGNGAVIYRADETTTGGQNAIDFQKATLTKNKENFFEIPLKDITPGTYKYLRVSIGYQNYDITYRVDTTYTYNGVDYPVNNDFTGTIASFIGFNNYITNYKIKTQAEQIYANKKQGYWAFESTMNIYGNPYNYVTNGQVPEGAITVVNPLHDSSPIPSGSCLVTGGFQNNSLVITGSETKDIKVKVKISTNNSFEWKDLNGNGKFDPLKGEYAVDMGVRGMSPVIE